MNRRRYRRRVQADRHFRVRFERFQWIAAPFWIVCHSQVPARPTRPGRRRFWRRSSLFKGLGAETCHSVTVTILRFSNPSSAPPASKASIPKSPDRRPRSPSSLPDTPGLGVASLSLSAFDTRSSVARPLLGSASRAIRYFLKKSIRRLPDLSRNCRFFLSNVPALDRALSRRSATPNDPLNRIASPWPVHEECRRSDS